jgi:hypothetical protein
MAYRWEPWNISTPQRHPAVLLVRKFASPHAPYITARRIIYPYNLASSFLITPGQLSQLY